jgi:hypothetical protein
MARFRRSKFGERASGSDPLADVRRLVSHFAVWHFSEVPTAASKGRLWIQSGLGKPPQGVFARQFQLTHQLENLLAFHRSSSAGCRIGRDSPPAHAAGAVRQE